MAMKRVLCLCIAAFLICSLFVETTNAEDTSFHVEDLGLPVSTNGVVCDGGCPGGARKLLHKKQGHGDNVDMRVIDEESIPW
ncbi:hypothetical protein AQUCO_02700156v1 [Aquilegia coerulea]|uniref:Neprosin activation peptide domain-containing protein n=1 Tax=Aquilegia coerulea TaxID=218851 RepID=A0A2G5D5I5_AQUCA|nr:hypothetical protein AQUCO_02700156v1 [Aquilegia coerulea]